MEKPLKNSTPAKDAFETVEPVGKRVLIRKDEDKKETKGGIRLPASRARRCDDRGA